MGLMGTRGLKKGTTSGQMDGRWEAKRKESGKRSSKGGWAEEMEDGREEGQNLNIMDLDMEASGFCASSSSNP